MLVELRIKNFAIINALNLEFDPGLVILTGNRSWKIHHHGCFGYAARPASGYVYASKR